MFRDRYDAGHLLAQALIEYKGRKDAIILAIPRGALQIGEILHNELNLPLDIIITKKIPHPANEEFAMGAIGPGGEFFVDSIASAGVLPEYVEKQKKLLAAHVEERYKLYRGTRPIPSLKGKIVIIVDDGIATGSTIIAAIHVIRKRKPSKIIVAVPVAPQNALEGVKALADEVVCLGTPELFFAIGAFYENFPQVEDDEAIAILKRCQKRA